MSDTHVDLGDSRPEDPRRERGRAPPDSWAAAMIGAAGVWLSLLGVVASPFGAGFLAGVGVGGFVLAGVVWTGRRWAQVAGLVGCIVASGFLVFLVMDSSTMKATPGTVAHFDELSREFVFLFAALGALPLLFAALLLAFAIRRPA